MRKRQEKKAEEEKRQRWAKDEQLCLSAPSPPFIPLQYLPIRLRFTFYPFYYCYYFPFPTSSYLSSTHSSSLHLLPFPYSISHGFRFFPSSFFPFQHLLIPVSLSLYSKPVFLFISFSHFLLHYVVPSSISFTVFIFAFPLFSFLLFFYLAHFPLSPSLSLFNYSLYHVFPLFSFLSLLLCSTFSPLSLHTSSSSFATLYPSPFTLICFFSFFIFLVIFLFKHLLILSLSALYPTSRI